MPLLSRMTCKVWMSCEFKTSDLILIVNEGPLFYTNFDILFFDTTLLESTNLLQFRIQVTVYMGPWVHDRIITTTIKTLLFL